MEMNPSPVIALNHAVAVAMSGQIEDGLKRIDDLGSGSLDQYYLFHAARADLLRRLNRHSEAAAAYQRALSLATNQLEIDFLVTAGSSDGSATTPSNKLGFESNLTDNGRCLKAASRNSSARPRQRVRHHPGGANHGEIHGALGPVKWLE